MSILNERDISFERIERGLQNYIKSVLEDDGSWTDFFESSTGEVLIRMLAGLGAHLNYRFEGVRRETYLETALFRSSIYLMAQLLGYPVNRKLPPLVQITGTYSGSEDDWERWIPIGTFGNYPITLLDFLSLPDGSGTPQSVTFIAALGEWKTSERITITDIRNWATLRFATGNYKVPNLTDVSGRHFFYLHSTPGTPGDVYSNADLLVDNIESFLLADDPTEAAKRVLIQTAYQGGVTVKYGDGTLGQKVPASGEVWIEFLETEGSVDGLASESSVSVSIPDFSVDSFSIVNYGSDEDSLEKLRTMIPAFYQTLRRAVTLVDHKTILLGYSGDLVSADARRSEAMKSEAGSCCEIEMSYLFADEHEATEAEALAMWNYMDLFKMVGTIITFVDPTALTIGNQGGDEFNVVMTVVIQPSAVSTSEVVAAITDAINESTLKLGATLHVANIMAAAYKVPGVVRAYMSSPTLDKTAPFATYYKLNSISLTFEEDSDFVYQGP